MTREQDLKPLADKHSQKTWNIQMSVYDCIWSIQKLWFGKTSPMNLTSLWSSRNGGQKGGL